MLNINEAKKKVLTNLPGAKIEKYVEYKNLFVFHVTVSELLEEGLDPFYSVNRSTGEFSGFPFMLPANFGPISELFSKCVVL